MTRRSSSATVMTWAVIAGLLATGFAAQGCSAPAAPGQDELLVGDDANGAKARGSQGTDAPEGKQQGSIELGQGTKSSEPPPDADRTKGDEGSNDAPAQCTVDAQCNQSGRICTGGSCVKGCRTNAGCATNETCSAGQCAPIDASVECTADFDCDYGTICIASRCVPGCYTSWDCPIGQGCSAGMCKVTTTTSTPPPSGATPCTSDGQCNPGINGSGQICGAQGTCVPGCHRDNQCPGIKICVSGDCR